MSNLDRLRDDLEKLVTLGSQLLNAIQFETYGADKVFASLNGSVERSKFDALVKSTPAFNDSYERWYSQSVAAVKQLLPDRLADFKSMYEKPKSRKDVDHGNYVIQDYLQGLTVRWAGEVKTGPASTIPQFQQQLAILKAAKDRFKSSLFEITQMVEADLFDSELSAARSLLKNGFVRAAGAMCGVLLERHLKNVCRNHNVPIKKKHLSIGELNDLLRSEEVIDQAQWRQLFGGLPQPM